MQNKEGTINAQMRKPEMVHYDLVKFKIVSLSWSGGNPFTSIYAPRISVESWTTGMSTNMVLGCEDRVIGRAVHAGILEQLTERFR